MIKLVFFTYKKPGLSDEEFHHHWRTRHAEVIRKHAQALGIVKYHQTHAIVGDPLNQPSDLFPERYDGIAEIWFKDRAHLGLWFDNSTPESKAAGKEIREDERKFVDRTRAGWIVADVLPIID